MSRFKLFVAVGCRAPAAVGASPLGAITNGHPDGNGHPDIGVLAADYEIPGYKQSVCSGTLVAERIFVTAAHCLKPEMDANNVWVSFDPVYRPGISTIYHGRMVTAADPTRYFGFAGSGEQYGNSDGGDDIAVVHLDPAPAPAPPITPAKLPPTGLLSSLDLKGQTFTAVGYGVLRIDKTKGPNNFDENFDPNGRYVTTQGSSASKISRHPVSEPVDRIWRLVLRRLGQCQFPRQL